jgi:2-oxo-4-hydroxy-4-carboxy-5-ureidoimidazoline decarboxylase
MTLDVLNRLTTSQAEVQLLQCCGSKRWAATMAAERPFRGQEVLLAAAERIWWSLDAADWLEAFAAHPRIGDRPTSAWSAQEQAAAAAPDEDVRRRLAEGNRAYERRFGYTFIVCATGRAAVDLLSVLERRLSSEAADELQVAAAEQRKITALRLEKLLTP